MINTNIIIADISHWQEPGSIDWKIAHDKSGVRGAIVKLVQNGVADPAHIQHLYDAYEGGVECLGVYDFGTETDDVQDFIADALTEFQGSLSTRLLVLDAEKSSAQITVPECENWVQAVHDKSERWPLVYMGRSGPDGTGKGLPSKVLSNCSLWLPAYGPHEENLGNILPPGWRMPQNDTDSAGVCRLWQFTGDGINAPSNWPAGIPPKCDLSYPVGFSSFDSFRRWWETL